MGVTVRRNDLRVGCKIGQKTVNTNPIFLFAFRIRLRSDGFEKFFLTSQNLSVILQPSQENAVTHRRDGVFLCEINFNARQERRSKIMKTVRNIGTAHAVFQELRNIADRLNIFGWGEQQNLSYDEAESYVYWQCKDLVDVYYISKRNDSPLKWSKERINNAVDYYADTLGKIQLMYFNACYSNATNRENIVAYIKGAQSGNYRYHSFKQSMLKHSTPKQDKSRQALVMQIARAEKQYNEATTVADKSKALVRLTKCTANLAEYDKKHC